jgi:restriction endonuclease Mrr
MQHPLLGVAVAVGFILIGYWWYKKFYIIRVATIQELLALPPSGFERAVATLLSDLGYRNVRVVGGAGDLARDISCQDQEGRKVMVQCKRYHPNRSVGSREIQLFIGMLTTEHKAERGIYVTTSRLTEPALNLALKHGIEVWDGSKLADLLLKVKKMREIGRQGSKHGQKETTRG